MKSETAWKRRFGRQKLKYALLVVVIVGIFFVTHQIFYLGELNQPNSGKFIAGKLSATHLMRNSVNNNDGSILLRGATSNEITKYLPNTKGNFVCFTSKMEIDFSKVNDDYCDCPIDGSDEPGTNACNNGVFSCGSSTTAVKIPSYKVNDGYCDCCDGSDEWASFVSTLHLSDELQNVASRTQQACVRKC